MNVRKATTLYEEWLARHLVVLPEDLAQKHANMAANVFSFFRAAFYRWMQRWPECPLVPQKAPQVLAIGDLHVENFGTWRDVEGRLVWGINDFDEACELPYTADLVRLAASAHLAISESHLAINAADACDAILTGYRSSLEAGGQPLVLAEEHDWLRKMVSGVLRDPTHFWTRLNAQTPVKTALPAAARKGIEKLLPEPGLPYRVLHRIAGLGSLGRERYVATANYRGAQIAREAKALAPSAAVFAGVVKGTRPLYGEIVEAAVRCPDPFVRWKREWIIRRLAPDCSRVELASLAETRDERKLLHAMGMETANVHLGTSGSRAEIGRDLGRRPAEWLHHAAGAMVEGVRNDWLEWRAQHAESTTPGPKAKRKKAALP